MYYFSIIFGCFFKEKVSMVRAPGDGMTFGADGMRSAPLPMLTGTAAVSTRLSEAAVL